LARSFFLHSFRGPHAELFDQGQRSKTMKATIHPYLPLSYIDTLLLLDQFMA
jgi:hypothetical protein